MIGGPTVAILDTRIPTPLDGCDALFYVFIWRYNLKLETLLVLCTRSMRVTLTKAEPTEQAECGVVISNYCAL